MAEAAGVESAARRAATRPAAAVSLRPASPPRLPLSVDPPPAAAPQQELDLDVEAAQIVRRPLLQAVQRPVRQRVDAVIPRVDVQEVEAQPGERNTSPSTQRKFAIISWCSRNHSVRRVYSFLHRTKFLLGGESHDEPGGRGRLSSQDRRPSVNSRP